MVKEWGEGEKSDPPPPPPARQTPLGRQRRLSYRQPELALQTDLVCVHGEKWGDKDDYLTVSRNWLSRQIWCVCMVKSGETKADRRGRLTGRDGERDFDGGAKRDTRETDRKGVEREKEYGELKREGLKKTDGWRGGGGGG